MKLFGTDGFRGKLNEGYFTEDSAFKIAKIIGYLLKTIPGIFTYHYKWRSSISKGALQNNIIAKNKVLIAKDTRATCNGIEQRLIDGLASMDIGVVRAGVLPTPALSFLARSTGAILGIMISASHNPPEYNGIKLISRVGLKIPDRAEEKIESLFFKNFEPRIRYLTSKSLVHNLDKKCLQLYTTFLTGIFGQGKTPRVLKIIVDCANGAATMTAKILDKFGVKAVYLNCSPDGNNINVNCGSLYPDKLRQKVLEQRVDLGVCFDGDQDRAIFIDEKGNVVDGDQALGICARYMKQSGRLSNDVVVGTIMSNLGLENYLKQEGIRFIRTNVGDKFVAEAMIKEKATLGGEQSGHIIFLDNLPTGDGIVTTLNLLSILGSSGKNLSELAGLINKYPQIIVSIDVGSKPPLEELKKVQDAIKSARQCLKESGRIIVRYSGTEDKCRIMVEGPSQPLIKGIADDVEKALKAEIGK